MTLADVRELLRHLPEDRRNKSTWQLVAADLDKAAAGADVADVAISPRIVLMPEHVEYHCDDCAPRRYSMSKTQRSPANFRLLTFRHKKHSKAA